MVKEKSSEKLRKQSLNYSVKDGIAYSVMDSTGNSYITPFAVALNASTRYIGLLASLPNLVSSLLQLKTVRIMEKENRKEIIVQNTLFQALMWLPIAILALFHPKLSLVLLIALYVVLVSSNAFIIPAWNSWMKDLIKDHSGQFFGNRSRIAGIVGLVVLLITGYMLDIFKNANLVFVGFFSMFIIAFFARIVSRYYLSRQYEPKFKLYDGYFFSFVSFIKKIKQSNFGRFAAYVSLFNFAVYVASPFFTVYMLKDLKLSYSLFTILSVAQSVATLIALPLWGRFADRYGNLKSIKISGMLIPLVPLLWCFSTNTYYLLAVQLFSGFVWASFNLSASNFIYDAVSRERMGLCVAYSTIMNTLAIFIGSSIGGFLASAINVGSPLLTLFLISAALRFLVSAIMLPTIKEVRHVEKGKLSEQLMVFLPLHNHNALPSNHNQRK